MIALSENVRAAVRALLACNDVNSDEGKQLASEVTRRLNELIQFGKVPMAAKAKLRWFQFSLGRFFIGITVLAFAMGFYVIVVLPIYHMLREFGLLR